MSVNFSRRAARRLAPLGVVLGLGAATLAAAPARAAGDLPAPGQPAPAAAALTKASANPSTPVNPTQAKSDAIAAFATVTIVDGSALLMRGAGGFAVAEGLRLQALDILETPADARLLRLEFADGRALSLGPGSRLMLDPRFAGERRSARAYLLRGWARLDASGAQPLAATAPALLASPAVDLLGASASALVRVDDPGWQVYVEAGDAAVQERQRGAPLGPPLKLKPGEFAARTGDAKAAVATRPAPAFVQAMPRSFADVLPARAALFKDRRVEPKALSEVRYADARDWLAAEPSLRRAPAVMARWRPLTQQSAFRGALVANMAAHPEWDRLLFPEKYLPKPASATEGAGTPPAYR